MYLLIPRPLANCLFAQYTTRIIEVPVTNIMLLHRSNAWSQPALARRTADPRRAAVPKLPMLSAARSFSANNNNNNNNNISTDRAMLYRTATKLLGRAPLIQRITISIIIFANVRFMVFGPRVGGGRLKGSTATSY